MLRVLEKQDFDKYLDFAYSLALDLTRSAYPTFCDGIKTKGYGTQAEVLLLKHAFEELGMVAVNADTVLKNTRSQHVLEKVGFRYTHEDDTFKYYRCENNKLMRDQLIQKLIGKEVHVVVDRPIGYHHGDVVYPINYGYIPGIIAGDGEEQDAYILGVNEPLTEFDGQVVAAIRRKKHLLPAWWIAILTARFPWSSDIC